MMIAGLVKRLRSIIHPRQPRLMLLISRPVGSLELQLYSMIFDEVAVESPFHLPGLGNQTGSQPINVSWAIRVPRAVTGLGELTNEAGSAVRIKGTHDDVVSLSSKGTANGHGPADQGDRGKP